MQVIKCPDTIARLVERRQELLVSKRNLGSKALFRQRVPELVMDKFREVPRPRAETGKLPVIMCLDRPLWGKLLGFRLDRYYQHPETFLEFQIRMDNFHLENVPDDQFVDDSIQVWGGPGFESTLFGMHQEYSAENEPWLHHQPLIDGRESLKSMPKADFQRGGPMPAVLAFHDRLQEMLDGSGWRAIPPGWIRGPWGVAEELRGIEALVMDTILDPALVQDILQYVVEFRKCWCLERARYLGCTVVPKGLMFNDEVQVPMISPPIYRDLLLPCEMELHRFHSGLHYWHSCGDATAFMPLVNQLPDIDMIQCGAYSRPEVVTEVFGQRTAVEIALHPVRDFVEATEEAMRERIAGVVRLCNDYSVKAACIRMTAYETTTLSPAQTLDKAIRWTQIAQEVTAAAG